MLDLAQTQHLVISDNAKKYIFGTINTYIHIYIIYHRIAAALIGLFS